MGDKTELTKMKREGEEGEGRNGNGPQSAARRAAAQDLSAFSVSVSVAAHLRGNADAHIHARRSL